MPKVAKRNRKEDDLFWNRAVLLGILSLILFLPATVSFGRPLPQLKCVASLFPLQEFARAVGQEWVQADLLLPPGAEPHNWEPKPSEVAKIHQADIFIYIGRGMEPWVEGLLKGAKSPTLKVVEASRGLPLLEEREEPVGQHFHRETLDPHVWLDFSLDTKIVDALAAAFSERDPAHASEYHKNAGTYKSKLEALDRQYRATLSKCRHRQIILGGHSAFAYLAKRYGLQQMALYGMNPNAEPTPRKLSAVIQSVRSQGVKFIYFERLLNPKLAQVLAKEAGVTTLPLSDGSNLTREQLKKKVTFLELMEMNLGNLSRGLDCDQR